MRIDFNIKVAVVMVVMSLVIVVGVIGYKVNVNKDLEQWNSKIEVIKMIQEVKGNEFKEIEIDVFNGERF